MKSYYPKPIDTGDVYLPASLLELTEKIAKNTHDVWALGRIREGWSYGEKRDDVQKTNPCIVEYEDLEDTEKEYDRNTSLETIKIILKLGYEIIPPENSKQNNCI